MAASLRLLSAKNQLLHVRVIQQEAEVPLLVGIELPKFLAQRYQWTDVAKPFIGQVVPFSAKRGAAYSFYCCRLVASLFVLKRDQSGLIAFDHLFDDTSRYRPRKV